MGSVKCGIGLFRLSGELTGLCSIRAMRAVSRLYGSIGLYVVTNNKLLSPFGVLHQGLGPGCHR